MRPEFSVIFQHANFPASQLITLDDLPPLDKLKSYLKPENVRLILVDHNLLQDPLRSIYAECVRGVIDHHEDENAVPLTTDPEPRVIEKCGSCTSLVSRTLRSSWDISSSSFSSIAPVNDYDVKTWNFEIAKMALASILVDTANLKAGSKVERADREAVEYLEGGILKALPHSKSWDRDQFYVEIDSAKSDIDNLRIDDIFRKDYKEWSENNKKLGIISVVKPLASLISKATTETPAPDTSQALASALKRFMISRALTLLATMTAFTSNDGAFCRELLLQTTQSGFDAAIKFKQLAAEELSLETLMVEGIDKPEASNGEQVVSFREVWKQKDVSKSRKQVAPLLRKAMR